MPDAINPALQKFVAQIAGEILVAQVIVTRHGRGYELRHVADKNAPLEMLHPVAFDGLRALAQSTTAGTFRPLKSAPNLPSGWRTIIADDVELGSALNHLYPGAVADWFWAQSGTPPVTHYRDFTNRQSGMYRITTMLSDEQAGRMIRACCSRSLCLKRRLWTVNALPPDRAEEKSLIPCLEPCAVLLESARRAVRLEQGDVNKPENRS